MGDKYFLSLECQKCGFKDNNAMFAPTYGITIWKCPKCGHVVSFESALHLVKKY